MHRRRAGDRGREKQTETERLAGRDRHRNGKRKERGTED